jgi:hypothetical protein
LGRNIIKFIEGIDLGKITVKILDLAIDLGVSAIKLIWGAYQEIYDKWGIAGILASLVIPGGILTLKFITEFSASIDDSKYVKKAKDAIENIKISAQEKWNEITNWWNNTAIVNWWNNDVMPWFTKAKWQSLGDNAKDSLQDSWTSFNNWWSSTGIYNWWDNLGLNFPHIKMPHFDIDGEFSLTPPQVPKISVDCVLVCVFAAILLLFSVILLIINNAVTNTIPANTAIAISCGFFLLSLSFILIHSFY